MSDLDNAADDAELMDSLTPAERLYAMILVTLGDLVEEPITQRAALLEAGLPANSHVPFKPNVRQFVSVLVDRMEGTRERIAKLQEIGVELALRSDIMKLLDPKTDEKLRFKIGESMLDRNPQTAKQRVQVNQNRGGEPGEGFKAFLAECARRKALTATATERKIEFQIEGPKEEPC